MCSQRYSYSDCKWIKHERAPLKGKNSSKLKDTSRQLTSYKHLLFFKSTQKAIHWHWEKEMMTLKNRIFIGIHNCCCYCCNAIFIPHKIYYYCYWLIFYLLLVNLFLSPPVVLSCPRLCIVYPERHMLSLKSVSGENYVNIMKETLAQKFICACLTYYFQFICKSRPNGGGRTRGS